MDERGELHEAYKEYVDMNGVTLVKDIAKRMTNKEKLELVSELFNIQGEIKKRNTLHDTLQTIFLLLTRYTFVTMVIGYQKRYKAMIRRTGNGQTLWHKGKGLLCPTPTT